MKVGDKIEMKVGDKVKLHDGSYCMILTSGSETLVESYGQTVNDRPGILIAKGCDLPGWAKRGYYGDEKRNTCIVRLIDDGTLVFTQLCMCRSAPVTHTIHIDGCEPIILSHVSYENLKQQLT